MDRDLYSGPERRRISVRPPDVGSIAAASLIIIGVTMLMLSLGGAIGYDVPAEAAIGSIATEFASWAVFSALVGTLVGSMVGGLLCARHSVTAAIGHGLAACAGAIVFGALLGAIGVPGLLGSAMTFGATNIGVAATAAIGWDGWALFIAAAASYVVAVIGWMAGLAMQPRASKELRIEAHQFVRPLPESDEVRAHSRV